MSVFDKNYPPAPVRSLAEALDSPPYSQGTTNKPSLEAQAGDAIQGLVSRYDHEVGRLNDRIVQLEEQLGAAQKALVHLISYAKGCGPGGGENAQERPF